MGKRNGPSNGAHHLRGAAASGECVMLCGDQRFLPFFQAGAYFYRYMYMWDLHHLGRRPFQLQRGNTYPGAGTNFTRSSIITFRTSASGTTRSTLPSTACSDSSESSRSERSFPHAATTCKGLRESGVQTLSVATIISGLFPAKGFTFARPAARNGPYCSPNTLPTRCC